jgi:hypothetical protein
MQKMVYRICYKSLKYNLVQFFTLLQKYYLSQLSNILFLQIYKTLQAYLQNIETHIT